MLVCSTDPLQPGSPEPGHPFGLPLAGNGKTTIQKISYLILLLLFSGCSLSDDNNEESATCFSKDFQESFIIEPMDCIIFNDNPEMTFTFLGFEPFAKSPHFTPHVGISARLEEGNISWEFTTGMVYEDNELEGTSFSGRVHTGSNNVDYTIFFDNIEFEETETHFIFHRATIRFGYFESEFN